MKKLLLGLLILGPLTAQAFNFNLAEGTYVVKTESTCTGDKYDNEMSPEILIRNPGLYSEIQVTPKVMNGNKVLALSIVDGYSRSETNIALNNSKYTVEKNKISYKNEGNTRIGSCDLFGNDVPCYRPQKWDLSWSLTFKKNTVIYTWSNFEKSGKCEFLKLK